MFVNINLNILLKQSLISKIVINLEDDTNLEDNIRVIRTMSSELRYHVF